MSPHPVDIHVGKQLRMQRIIMGLSQEALAKAVGITFQQVQKYERGVNRMSSSRLFEFSQVLNVSIAYFFEGYDDHGAAGMQDTSESVPGVSEGEAAEFEPEQVFTRESLELMRCFHRVKSPQVKRRIVELTRAVADNKPLLEEEEDATPAPSDAA